MRRRAAVNSPGAAQLIPRSIRELHTEIEPLMRTATPVSVGLLSFARLVVERIDCQLACRLDGEAITALELEHVIQRAEDRVSHHGLVRGRARARCPILLSLPSR